MTYFLKASLFLLVMFSVTTSKAQLYKNNIREYKARIPGEAAKLIKSGELFLTADSLSQTFKPNGYGPIAVDLESMKKKKLEPGKIYNRVAEATVIVSPTGKCGELTERGTECEKIHSYPATGYIIDSKGIIVTNYHVANGYVTKNNTTSRDVMIVMLKDGTTFPVTEVLSADQANDLAILKIDPKGRKLPALPIATKDAEIGDPVFIVSHPKGFFYAFSSGMVTDKFSENNWRARQYRNIMAISADFAAGSSGGAIIDQFGNVIGTVSYTKTLQHSDDPSKTQMILKATIPAAELLKLIKEGNIKK
ncbi:S1 family peptidase [Formosa sp. S-31]|uniref:S1 family peptidase n=1 Tax=Formosa sp. S-31 TaxID=2790949 RepID=UPI003EBCF0F5